jgi:hypothetical protein
MFLASWGGVSKFDGQKFHRFTTKQAYLRTRQEGFSFKSKNVGTEQGVSIIDIKTNKVVSPQVPTQKRILLYVFAMKEKYFHLWWLYKIDESEYSKIIPMLHKKHVFLGLLGLLCITQTMDLLISLIL